MTDKHRLIERMEVTPKHTNAQKWAWTETLILLFVVMAMCLIVFVVNALIPKGF